ncbi:MAG: BTAD domain-containing putative transcriptional regulator, partial [Candidatus Promineifilaceae bacterium]|nr:BTAD domain-containing putative transcriptional regulator [Candidatus Promineifilaceae bacterium]
MSTLDLALLGPFEASLDGQSAVSFRTTRAQALLAYLATEFALGAGQQSREALMELLWPGMPPDSARTNLRQNLYYLRQSIPAAPAADGREAIPFLLSGRQTVAVNSDYPLSSDVQQFSVLLAGPQADWAVAVALYRGEFLSDFYLPDTSPFEEWAAARRAVFRRQLLDALALLTDSSVSQGKLDEGERYARRQLAIDPLRETAYRQLMTVLYRSGRRAEALRLYQECARLLEEELDAPPSRATIDLAEAIRAGTLAGRPELDERGSVPEAQPDSGKKEAEVGPAQNLESPAPAEPARSVRHSLPVAATRFVGREQELAALTELIGDPQVRLITILGPGGIGKTRLALEAADRLRQPPSPFPDGVFFVPLAPLESAAELEATLASVLDLIFKRTGRAASGEKEQLLEQLARKKMLLLMDNFEHILDGRALLAEISKVAPGVKLLVTSRERLQLHGEQIFPVHGLEMPQEDGSAAEARAGYPAAELFLNIARRTLPDFELYAGDAAQILRICRLVEGMPLGLELAASWAGLLPLADIAADIEQSLQLLSTEHHDVPSRHRSMQATLDVSWNRLSPEQRRACQQLTVFRGGCTRAAAVEVAGATLPLLVALVNKSWLSYDRKNDRYHIHELLRQYGSGKLKSDSALELAVRNRHSAYFCGFLKERESDWFRARQLEALAEVRAEIENIQSAWRRAASQGDGRLLAQATDSLGRFYAREMRVNAGKQAFRSAAEGLSEALAHRAADAPHSLTLWSRILAWQAHFTAELDQNQKLLSQSQDALNRVKATGRDTTAEQAFIFLEQAYATRTRDYKASIRFSKLALELSRELGDRAGEAEALKELGLGYRRLGKPKQAYKALRENLAIRQQLNDPFGIAQAMNWLGLVALSQLKLSEAEQLCQQALELFRQLGNRYYEADALLGLTFAKVQAGELLAARALVDQALRIERDFGLSMNLWVHIASAYCDLNLGRYAEARSETRGLLDLARQRGLTEEIGSGLDLLGAIAAAQGDLEQAESYFRESIAVFKEATDVARFRPQAGLGFVARAQSDESLARQCLHDVLRAAKDYDY